MLRNLLGKTFERDLVTGILNYGIYYPVIITAITLCLILAYKRLVQLDYSKNQIKKFSIIILASFYPVIFLSTRLANMFYHPSSSWSLDFFINQTIDGPYITFHAGIYLPFVLVFISSIIMKMKPWKILDIFFLYLPLGHAIGRIGCFLVGCCWGNMISVNVFGKNFSFQNPVPLYSIFINLMIFLILRMCYEKFSINDRLDKFNGLISSLYLILYGNARLILEIFRTEKVVAWGLTHAQIVMILFIAVGSILFFYILLKSKMHSNESGGMSELDKKKYFYSIIVFTLIYVIISLTAKFIFANNIIKWPFRSPENTADAYMNILRYSTFFFLAVFSIILLHFSKISFFDYFKRINWKEFSRVFLLGLAASSIYAVYALSRVKFGFNKLPVWPPVIILSLLNAFAEETIFRLVFYKILDSLIENPVAANLAQAFFYSAFHFFIGGPMFGIAAFLYGILLGIIFYKHNNILPCVLCHFIIDLGAIGAPLLSS